MFTECKLQAKSKSEYHIFIIWSNAQQYEQELLTDIGKDITLIKSMEINWPNNEFDSFLTRFYGDSLKRVNRKIKECGRGPFTLIIVKDCNPIYQVRNTSSSPKVVNSNIFDLKIKYRKMTNAGHLIHGSDDFKEASFQYKLLTGEDISEVENLKDIQLLERPIIGFKGWDTLDDIWRTLSGDVDYVVLRNFETLEDELNKEHPDIDLLTTDKNKLIRILGLKKAQSQKYRAQYFCYISGRRVNFDLRVPGDGYYPSGWSFDLINNKIKFGLINVVNNKDYFWSLMYHALFHKRSISFDYLERLHKLALKVEPDIANEMWDREFLTNRLMKHVLSNGWIPSEPDDHTVYYNYSEINVNLRNISIQRRLRQFRYKFMSRIKQKLSTVYAKFT